MNPHWLTRALLAAAVAALACEGRSTSALWTPEGAPATPSFPLTPDDPGLPPRPTLESTPVSGLRRLTAHELDNTVRDLLGDPTRAAASLLPLDPRHPFDNDYTDQVPSLVLVEGLELAAREAAARLRADATRRSALLGCQPSGPGDEACFRRFLQSFGRLALRRPLSADELTRYETLLALGVEANDFYAAVESALMLFLQHHELIYRVELGAPVKDRPGLYQLGDFELATRLSYLLWASAPDAALLEAVETGQLRTDAGLRQATARLLADPRARAQAYRFHALWMGFERLPFSADLSAAMTRESSALVERVVFDDVRPWQDLFRSNESFLTDALATHYGLPSTGSDSPQWVSYADPARRGILSHGTFLSNGFRFGDTSPTQRGIAVRERLFCMPVPPPPPLEVVDEPPQGGASDCKEDRYRVHAQPSCAGCHSLTDNVGFGLENYDDQGRYRATEPGKPECTIRGEGEVVGVGKFRGPGELGEMLLRSQQLNACAVSQLYRMLIGRHALDDTDLDVVEKVVARLGGDGADFRFDQLLLELVTAEPFRFRRVE
jgi:hypothetical protein